MLYLTKIDTMRRYGMDNWETAEIPFSQHSYDELYREILDAKIRQGDTQDLARFKRKINISGHIASAATTFAAITGEDGKLAPESKTAVSIWLTFNQDGVSMLSKDDKKRRSMRTTKKSRNVGRTTTYGTKTLSKAALEKLSASRRSKKLKDNSISSSSSHSVVASDIEDIVPRISNESTISSLSLDSASLVTPDTVTPDPAECVIVEEDDEDENNSDEEDLDV